MNTLTKKALYAGISASLLVGASALITPTVAPQNLAYAESGATASTNDDTTKIQFTDRAVDMAVRQVLKKQPTDPITRKDVKTITELDLSAKIVDERPLSVSDLSGLEHLVSLKKLNLAGNQLSFSSEEAAVTSDVLKKLTSLEVLNLRGNSIQDVTFLKELTNLKDLDLSENEIYDATPLSEVEEFQKDTFHLNVSKQRVYATANLSHDLIAELPHTSKLSYTEPKESDFYTLKDTNGKKSADFSRIVSSDSDKAPGFVGVTFTQAGAQTKFTVSGEVIFPRLAEAVVERVVEDETRKNPSYTLTQEQKHHFTQLVLLSAMKDIKRDIIPDYPKQTALLKELDQLVQDNQNTQGTDAFIHADVAQTEAYEHALDLIEIAKKAKPTSSQLLLRVKEKFTAALQGLNGAQNKQKEPKVYLNEIVSWANQVKDTDMVKAYDLTVDDETLKFSSLTQKANDLKAQDAPDAAQTTQVINQLKATYISAQKAYNKNNNDQLKKKLQDKAVHVLQKGEGNFHGDGVYDKLSAKEKLEYKAETSLVLQALNEQNYYISSDEVDYYTRMLEKTDEVLNRYTSQGGSSSSSSGAASDVDTSVSMWRLYNPYTGEHLFTTDKLEAVKLSELGWKHEGMVGKVNAKTGMPVYRLYNAYTGEHHFTMSEAEVQSCVAAGWTNEGIKFYGERTDSLKAKPMISMYNPYEKAFYHHYTSDEKEIATMQKAGWIREDAKWYVSE